MPAAFDQYYVKRLHGKRIKKGKNKCDLASQIRNDIAEFKTKTDRQVLISDRLDRDISGAFGGAPVAGGV